MDWNTIEALVARREATVGPTHDAIVAELKTLEPQAISDYLADPANCYSETFQQGGFSVEKGQRFYTDFKNLVDCSLMFRGHNYPSREEIDKDRIGFILKHREHRKRIDAKNEQYWTGKQ